MPNRIVRILLAALPRILKILRSESKKWTSPAIGAFTDGGDVPYKVLVTTLLSLRTKDAVTLKAGRRLLAVADTPQQMLKLTARQIEALIYPVGFYRTKAKNLLEISRQIMTRCAGEVPDSLEELLTLPGVGRKTANLVMILGHGKSGLCVDTHVHRITNRWGLVCTRTPDETEQVLREILPRRYWNGANELLVAYGQNLCVPVSPFCGRCKLAIYCRRVGVVRSR